MTFLGTIPNPLRSIIKEAAQEWPAGDVYIACAGNMTIERTLRDSGPGFVSHSNDVSIYTTALGSWLAGEKVMLALSDEYAVELDWLAPYLDGDTGSLAALMLATHFIDDLGSEHPWKRRNVEAHIRDFPSLHAKTVEKLTANRFEIGSYACKDVRAWLDEDVPEDATICSFPPFDKGGYEKLYQRLDEVFVWPKPEYEILDQDGVDDVVDKITSRPRWLIGLLTRRAELEEYLVGYVLPTPSARAFYVYAKGGSQPTRFVKPQTKVVPVTIPRLSRGDEIGDSMKLVPLKQEEFAALRGKYLNAGIKVSGGNIKQPFAILVDDKMIGVVASGLGVPGARGRYLLTTDFAVAPHDYPKLSKLVIMAATSTEHQRILERMWSARVREFQTAVYTNNAASMKYRGLFDLTERVEQDEGESFKYKLVYRADLGKWTLDEALAIWKEKWGTRKISQEESK